MHARGLRLEWLLASTGLAFSLAAACGGNPSQTEGGGGSSGDQGEGGGFVLGLGGTGPSDSGGAAATDLTLEVTAEQQEIEVTGEPVTVQLSARYDDGSTPNQVSWSVDDTRLGSVSDAGEFTANGFVGGE